MGVADVRHQEIINRADGGRLSAWDDVAAPGVPAGIIREPNADYESRTSTQWELEEQGDGSWLVRNEKNTTVCLQPESEPKPNVRVVLKPCTGDRNQTWQIVAEETDLDPRVGPTGWWSLRPTTNPKLAVAPQRVGFAFSDVRLFRATNSADRLWHHKPADKSW
ncbi:RICIN domain-containing protein [Streptomyces sp. B1I3]|uniref:RICIN domain-containing protein n=1 Tax=Streptomyces sp. B1I3 TaxID=3042264 RepID=UPI00277F6808|nr:RICIN domain-containing protein [Streptomyces sp. B1I3]MDQ0791697.1 hypothetical protein [Streptomyces sp. B1I3]